MSETKFRIVSSELVHLGLAKERCLKGLQTEHWREKYPDQCAVMYDGQVLAFASSLGQVLFQIDEAVSQNKHGERICVFFIDDTSEHRQERQAAAKASIQEGLMDVETMVNVIQEKLMQPHAAAESVVAELQEVCSPADWQKILYEVVRTKNHAFLELVDGLGLPIDPEDLWIAKKILHDTEKAFPKGTI